MSLDLEQRFICALLTASRNAQEEFYARQFPQRLFRIREPEISWIYTYRANRNIYPSPAILSARFKWTVVKVKETWPELLDAVIGQEHYRQIKQVVDSSRELIDQGVPLPKVVTHFKNLSERISLYEADSTDIDLAKSSGALLRYAQIKQMKKTPGGTLFQTPWPSLNKIIKFCRPEDLVVLVGRLGMGKSWMLIFWALWLAEQGHSVLFVSKEMSLQAIEDRVEALRFRLDWELMRDGSLSAKEEIRWRREKLKHWKADFKITGKESLEGTGFGEIVTAIRKYKPQAVFVDAAYRVVLDGAMQRKSDTEKLTYIAQTSKRVAKSEKVLLVASTQMNRDAEDKKGNTKGGVTTVFGADAWAQESDFLLEVHGNRNQPNVRGTTILKGRESGTGTVMTNFQLSPYPDFSESTKAQMLSAANSVKFQGI